MLKEKIALVADSACDLPKKLIEQYSIHILPLKVVYGDKVYSDRVDIQPEEVYARMPGLIPTTSMPGVQEIRDLFELLRTEGFTHVLALHLSGGLSGTCENVRSVAKEISGMQIKVFDTNTLSFGTGWMVLDAARNIAAGLSFDTVVAKYHELQPRVQVYYIIETLEYLAKGGRIGRVSGMLGTLLDIKPIISVDTDGKYFTYCKARGRKRSIEKLCELVENAVKESRINLAVLHGGAWEECQRLLERLKQLPNINELVSSDISPALGVHTGPGLLGVVFHRV